MNAGRGRARRRQELVLPSVVVHALGRLPEQLQVLGAQVEALARPRHDYSSWIHEAIRDEDLAAEVPAVEDDKSLRLRESRERVSAAISKRYTAAA